MRNGGREARRVAAVSGLERVRVGVVGCGMVAQAEHLPNLLHLHPRFEIAALADPSRIVREAMAARYAVRSVHEDYRSLLDGRDVDAVLVSAPAAVHADVVLAALDAGLDVFVEKPLCITLADADRIVAARDRSGKVVQVGYMKRYDPAWERMRADLPGSAAELRYVRVTCHDPEWVPFFTDVDIVRGTDVAESVIAATKQAEVDQVREAVADASSEAVFAFSDAYLGSMVHDVNVVHGLLEQLGEPLPARVVDAAWWNGGRAITGSLQLANGARWDNAWIQLLDIREYQEQVVLYFRDSLRQLTFPSPWLRQAPTRYERSEADELDRSVRLFESHRESFVRELEHFHDCVTNGAECRTPPEQARLDIEVLTQMFVHAAHDRSAT